MEPLNKVRSELYCSDSDPLDDELCSNLSLKLDIGETFNRQSGTNLFTGFQFPFKPSTSGIFKETEPSLALRSDNARDQKVFVSLQKEPESKSSQIDIVASPKTPYSRPEEHNQIKIAEARKFLKAKRKLG